MTARRMAAICAPLDQQVADEPIQPASKSDSFFRRYASTR